MAEPITTSATAGAASLTGGLIILLGPVLGPWAAVLLTAIIGSMWTLSRVDTSTRSIAAFYVLRVICTTLVLTGIVTALVSDYVKAYLPEEHMLPAVSFVLSAMGDKLQLLKDIALKRFQALFSGGTAQ